MEYDCSFLRLIQRPLAVNLAHLLPFPTLPIAPAVASSTPIGLLAPLSLAVEGARHVHFMSTFIRIDDATVA